MVNRQRGFSLLEVLVAFAILGLVLGALLSLFSQGLRQVGQSEFYSAAALQMANLQAQWLPNTQPQQQGTLDQDWSWHLTLARRPMLQSNQPRQKQYALFDLHWQLRHGDHPQVLDWHGVRLLAVTP